MKRLYLYHLLKLHTAKFIKRLAINDCGKSWIFILFIFLNIFYAKMCECFTCSIAASWEITSVHQDNTSPNAANNVLCNYLPSVCDGKI